MLVKETDPMTAISALSRISALSERAQAGDEEARTALIETINNTPSVWKTFGDIRLLAEAEVIQVIGGDSPLQTECFSRKLDEFKKEMAGPHPSPLERALVDRIGVCWLQVYHADQMEARALSKFGSGADLDRYQRRQDRVHKRFLSAVKALAQVRKLQLPMLQVNIADQQVNIQGG